MKGLAKRPNLKVGAKKRHGIDMCMLFFFIYFFAPFSIFYMWHNKSFHKPIADKVIFGKEISKSVKCFLLLPTL